jgi:hypothetical protein
MSKSYVFNRTVMGFSEIGVSLRESCFSLRLPFGSDWTSLRIGLRFIFDPQGTPVTITGGPRMRIGLTSNDDVFAGGIGSISHFVGYYPNDVTWTASASGYGVAGGGSCAYQVGTTVNFYTMSISSGSAGWGSTVTSARCLMLEIIKGSPNWGVRMAVPNAPANGAVTREAFYALVLDHLVTNASAWSANAYQNSNSTAAPPVNEAANGPMNTVIMAWDRAVPSMDVYDFCVKKVY